MKEGWEIKKLTDICSIQYGCAFDSSLFSVSPEDGMPLIRIRDVKEGCTSTYYKGTFADDYIIHKGDYLIGMDGEFNIEPWKSDNALLNQRVCKIDSKSKDISIRYIYRFLKKELKRIEDETPFVTVKHLSAKRLNQVFLSVPSIAEQEKIVAELDCLSGIIEKKKQQLKEYDALAQSIFYEIFGDPVEKIKDWETFRLEDLCDIITKGTTPTTLGYKFVETGINFLKVESFSKDETIDDSKIAHITSECHEALKRSSLQEDDILLCIAGATVGRLARVPKCVIPANTNQAFAIIRLKKENSDKLQYIYSYLHSPFIQDIVVESKKGVAQPNLTLSQVRNFKIVIPPDDIRDIFVGKINLIEKNKRLIAESIKEVETLFNSRMDYYFN